MAVVADYCPVSGARPSALYAEFIDQLPCCATGYFNAFQNSLAPYFASTTSQEILNLEPI